MITMDTWSPIWSKIVDSSLWEEPDFVVKVFMTMLAKKDADFIVRGNAYEIARWARKTEAEALKALEVLSRPDKRRLEPQEHDGRRIEKVEEGWLILNGEKYREAIRKIKRKQQQADNQRAYRERQKLRGKPLPGEAAALAAEARGDRNGADSITTAALPEAKTPDRREEVPSAAPAASHAPSRTPRTESCPAAEQPASLQSEPAHKAVGSGTPALLIRPEHSGPAGGPAPRTPADAAGEQSRKPDPQLEVEDDLGPEFD